MCCCSSPKLQSSFEVEMAAVLLAPAVLSRELSSGKHKIIGESLIQI